MPSQYQNFPGGTWSPPTWNNQWSPNSQYPQPSQYGQPRQQPVNNVLRVTGPESAKAYSVPPNSVVVLFDGNDAVFYLKSTDDSGFATLRTFRFDEVEQDRPQQVEVHASVPKEDPRIEEMQKDMLDIKGDISALKELMEGLVS